MCAEEPSTSGAKDELASSYQAMLGSLQDGPVSDANPFNTDESTVKEDAALALGLTASCCDAGVEDGLSFGPTQLTFDAGPLSQEREVNATTPMAANQVSFSRMHYRGSVSCV